MLANTMTNFRPLCLMWTFHCSLQMWNIPCKNANMQHVRAKWDPNMNAQHQSEECQQEIQKNGALASLTTYSGSSPGDVSQTIHICDKLSFIAPTLTTALQEADFFSHWTIHLTHIWPWNTGTTTDSQWTACSQALPPIPRGIKPLMCLFRVQHWSSYCVTLHGLVYIVVVPWPLRIISWVLQLQKCET